MFLRLRGFRVSGRGGLDMSGATFAVALVMQIHTVGENHTLGQPNYAMVDPSRACDAVSCDVRCEASDRCRLEKRV